MKISIITVNLNDEDGLKRTILSVRLQTYTNYEFVIIDGKSTDGSVKIIEANKDIVSVFISELDNGIYDAMNKGLSVISGDFVIFLNSGDNFYDKDVLSHVVNSIKDPNKVYFGSAKVYYDDISFYFMPKLNCTSNEFKQFFKKYQPCHQAMFFPKSFYSNNKYNQQYKISGDYDYKIRAIQSYGYIFINTIISCFILGGTSTPDSFLKIIRWNREGLTIDKRNEIFSFKIHCRRVAIRFVKYFIYLIFGKYYQKIFVRYKKI